MFHILFGTNLLIPLMKNAISHGEGNKETTNKDTKTGLVDTIPL